MVRADGPVYLRTMRRITRPLPIRRYREGLAGPFRALTGLLALSATLLACAPVAARAQAREAARFGITVGGISTIGMIIEYVDGQSSWEINIGTWSFRDLSVSLVRRWYLGTQEARPTVGAGLWGVLAFPPDSRASFALVARAPVGVEWSFTPRHAAVVDINVNQGLFIRRSDPDDDTPMNRRLIPLPGLSYRWRSR